MTRIGKLIIFTSGLLGIVSAAHAEPVSSIPDSAITLCPSPDNIYEDGLKKLGGNLFVNHDVSDLPNGFRLIKADVYYSFHSMDKSIMAADTYLGTVNLEMGYEARGFSRSLVCRLEITRVQ
ncbi:MAG: hypothetical protein AB7T49_04090 [Oligoflexales bacterium]